jgi:hypothetical protein
VLVSINELVMATELTAPSACSRAYSDAPDVLGNGEEVCVNEVLIRDIPVRLPVCGAPGIAANRGRH